MANPLTCYLLTKIGCLETSVTQMKHISLNLGNFYPHLNVLESTQQHGSSTSLEIYIGIALGGVHFLGPYANYAASQSWSMGRANCLQSGLRHGRDAH